MLVGMYVKDNKLLINKMYKQYFLLLFVHVLFTLAYILSLLRIMKIRGKIANMDIIYRSVHPYNSRGGDRFLARNKCLFTSRTQ